VVRVREEQFFAEKRIPKNRVTTEYAASSGGIDRSLAEGVECHPEGKSWGTSSSKYLMAGFPLKIAVAVLCLGAVGVQAQMRPVTPGSRTSPARTAAASAPSGTPNAPAVVQQSQRGAAAAPAGPTVPPVVTYRDGLLTVQATNSSLSSVVKAIRNKTGIEFEGMEGISEQVALSLGPAPAAEVLSAIFSGPKYDLVAIGRPDSPSIVQRVIVTVKSKGGAADAPPQPRPAGQDADDDDTPDEQVNSGDVQEAPPQPAPTPQPAPQAQQQPKSPEQLLQELQDMQKQKAVDPNNPSTAPRKQPQF
jgi:hypothetical protein